MAVVTLLALLAAALPLLTEAGTASVTLTIPNTTYPALGEYLQMVVTYNDTPDPHLEDVTYPNGHVITAMTGTRSVWQASAVAPSTYTLNSTANILGVVPASASTYWMYDPASSLIVPYTGPVPPQLDSAPYGSKVVYATYNGTDMNGPGGYFLYPQYNVVYNNFLYLNGVADYMDYSGWLIQLDRYQPGNLNISQQPGYSAYPYAVNYFS